MRENFTTSAREIAPNDLPCRVGTLKPIESIPIAMNGHRACTGDDDRGLTACQRSSLDPADGRQIEPVVGGHQGGSVEIGEPRARRRPRRTLETERRRHSGIDRATPGIVPVDVDEGGEIGGVQNTARRHIEMPIASRDFAPARDSREKSRAWGAHSKVPQFGGGAVVVVRDDEGIVDHGHEPNDIERERFVVGVDVEGPDDGRTLGSLRGPAIEAHRARLPQARGRPAGHRIDTEERGSIRRDRAVPDVDPRWRPRGGADEHHAISPADVAQPREKAVTRREKIVLWEVVVVARGAQDLRRLRRRGGTAVMPCARHGPET